MGEQKRRPVVHDEDELQRAMREMESGRDDPDREPRRGKRRPRAPDTGDGIGLSGWVGRFVRVAWFGFAAYAFFQATPASIIAGSLVLIAGALVQIAYTLGVIARRLPP